MAAPFFSQTGTASIQVQTCPQVPSTYLHEGIAAMLFAALHEWLLHRTTMIDFLETFEAR
jgi:hypothetical protein